MLDRGIFEHLGHTAELGLEKTDWRLGEVRRGRLWAITLHYHRWVWDLAQAVNHDDRAAKLFCHYLADWLDRCSLEQPGSLALAWNSYSIATRLGWWIRAYREAGSSLFRPQPLLEKRFLCSLWQQGAYLSDHLEWDLRGNHLLRDTVGLALVGRFFAHPRAAEWLRAATELAVEQTTEQVLRDGGHFERSPKYQIDALEDVLTLALLVEDERARQLLVDRWGEMAEFLGWVCHPDGDIARLNDGVPGAACPATQILKMASWIGASRSEPARGGRFFPETGLVVWQGSRWSLFFDVGPVGPEYQPGHGHADTLTLEASYNGRRLVVDPGTYGYDDDQRRRYDRGTASHNTVRLDGRDSSEVWHIFRVGRRAQPSEVSVRLAADGLTAGAAHDGYRHLVGSPRPYRRLRVHEEEGVEILDRIGGWGIHEVSGGLLVEPSWEVRPKADGWCLVQEDEVVRVRVHGDPGIRWDLATEPRPYHPEIGVELTATRLIWKWRGELPLQVCTYLSRS